MSSTAGSVFVVLASWLGFACGSSSAPTTAPDAAAEADAYGGICLIEAANYDQSCSADTDCVGYTDGFPVNFGNYCQGTCFCGGDAINKSAAAKFVRDVRMTPTASQIHSLTCGGCPANATPGCCVQGRCTVGCTHFIQDAAPALDALVVTDGVSAEAALAEQ
jgi:hypothetical protein